MIAATLTIGIAPAAQPARVGYVPNRAPRGGAISSVNGRWYAGGQFLPAVADPATANKPAALVGSSRQVAWATRLRDAALAAKDAELAGLLFALTAGKPAWALLVRDEYRTGLAERHAMVRETSAAKWIDRRVG
jgi:hypothetical protein